MLPQIYRGLNLSSNDDNFDNSQNLSYRSRKSINYNLENNFWKLKKTLGEQMSPRFEQKELNNKTENNQLYYNQATQIQDQDQNTPKNNNNNYQKQNKLQKMFDSPIKNDNGRKQAYLSPSLQQKEKNEILSPLKKNAQKFSSPAVKYDKIKNTDPHPLKSQIIEEKVNFEIQQRYKQQQKDLKKAMEQRLFYDQKILVNNDNDSFSKDYKKKIQFLHNDQIDIQDLNDFAVSADYEKFDSKNGQNNPNLLNKLPRFSQLTFQNYYYTPKVRQSLKKLQSQKKSSENLNFNTQPDLQSVNNNDDINKYIAQQQSSLESLEIKINNNKKQQQQQQTEKSRKNIFKKQLSDKNSMFNKNQNNITNGSKKNEMIKIQEFETQKKSEKKLSKQILQVSQKEDLPQKQQQDQNYKTEIQQNGKNSIIRKTILPHLIKQIELDYSKTIIPVTLRGTEKKKTLKINDQKDSFVTNKFRQSEIYEKFSPSREIKHRKQKEQRESLLNMFQRVDEESFCLDKYPMLKIETIILDASSYLEQIRLHILEQINKKKQLKQHIEGFCQMNIDIFIFHFMSFVKFCLPEFESEKQENKTHFQNLRLDKETAAQLRDFICFKLEKINYQKEKVIHFKSVYLTNFEQYLFPQNLLQELGGKGKVLQLIEGTIKELDQELNIKLDKFQFDELAKIGHIVCNLLQNQESEFIKQFKSYQKEKNIIIQNTEFFLLKKSLFSLLLKDEVTHEKTKRKVVQSLEQSRNLIFQNNFEFFQKFETFLVKDTQIQRTFQNNLKTSSKIQDLNQIFCQMVSGFCQRSSFINYLNENIKIQVTEQFLSFLEISALEIVHQIPQTANILISDLKMRFWLLKYKFKVKTNFVNLIGEQKPQGFLKLLNQKINIHISTNDIGNYRDEQDLLNTHFLEFLLQISIYDEEMYSLYDITFASNYYNVKKKAFQLWMKLTKEILQSQHQQQTQQQTLIQKSQKTAINNRDIQNLIDYLTTISNLFTPIN